MAAVKATQTQRKNLNRSFERIRQVNGTHPLKDACPGSYVEYQVRHRKNATVVYFNFDLAREMGLIEADAPNYVTTDLSLALTNAFSIQIIN